MATIMICVLRNTAMGIAFAAVAYPCTAAPTYIPVFITLSVFRAVIADNLKKHLIPVSATQPIGEAP